MKGWYLIVSDNGIEPIEFIGKGAKTRAKKKAIELYKAGYDGFMTPFDDNGDFGYCTGDGTIDFSELKRQ